MDYLNFTALIQTLSSPALSFADAIKLVDDIRSTRLPAALIDIRAHYQPRDEGNHMADELSAGCDYWFAAFDLLKVAKNRSDIKQLADRYICRSTTGPQATPWVKCKYNMVQALMKCVVNQSTRKLHSFFVNHADPQQLWINLMDEIAKERGFSNVEEMAVALDPDGDEEGTEDGEESSGEMVEDWSSNKGEKSSE